MRGFNMTKIFLSPSNQIANVGAYGDTNESEQCTLIANATKEYLDDNYECEVYVATQSENVKTRANYANTQDTDIYLAIHTNAFKDKTVEGTETFYYSTDIEGKKLAEMLLESVSNITNAKRRAKAYDNLIELNTPTCTRAYLEVDFHSNPQKAQWIKQNTELIGNTIGKTIAEFAHLETIKEKLNQDDSLLLTDTIIIENLDTVFDIIKKHISVSTTGDKLYRVQVGAYSSKENAQKMTEQLKNAGFQAIIKYE